jgi:diadenosine tetraphosphatase ApaH/serine/threonine PP2A family protein phosphatase
LHANLEALETVLEGSEGAYDRAICCGDLVGYGADPNPVVEWARTACHLVIRGNHDKASAGLEDLEWFNPAARSAALWTQHELTPENADYLRALPKGPIEVNGFNLVHGSPLDEDEYVVGSADAVQTIAYVESRIYFFGHTHIQGGFSFHDATLRGIPRPGESGVYGLTLLEDAIYLLNPGSVGQPRDGDPRCAFLVYDTKDQSVLYRRLPYDVEGAQAKIRRAGLPPVLADRLSVGR